MINKIVQSGREYIPKKVVRKTWGNEFWIVNTPKYCGKRIRVNSGAWSSKGRWHYHKEKDETFIVIEGTLKLLIKIGDKEFEGLFIKDQCYRIPPGMRHKFTAVDGKCTFWEVSTHHDDSDTYYED